MMHVLFADLLYLCRRIIDYVKTCLNLMNVFNDEECENVNIMNLLVINYMTWTCLSLSFMGTGSPER